jgi:hypothetical protein
MFSWNDEIIVEKIEKVLKISVVIIGLLWTLKSVGGDIAEDAKVVEQTANTVTNFSNAIVNSTVDGSTLQDGGTQSTIVYETIVLVGQEKGVIFSVKELEQVLTEAEKTQIAEISKSAKLQNLNLMNLDTLESKQGRLDIFGVKSCQTFYDIVENHKNDF